MANSSSFKVLMMLLLLLPLSWSRPSPDSETQALSRPNRQDGLERFLGMGVVLPYPYFQKPRYRYPVYDREGRGYGATYGYGDNRTFRYTKFDKAEGHH